MGRPYLHRPDVEWLDEKDLRDLQFTKLRRQLVRVYESSAYYRKKFKDAGVDPHKIRSWEDYYEYPTFDKDEERESQIRSREELGHPYGMHVTCDVRLIERVSATSGTTGMPTYIGYTGYDRSVSHDHYRRFAARIGMNKGDRVMFAGVMSMWVAGIPSIDSLLAFGACVIPIGGLASTERVAQTAMDTRPEMLVCTPSYGLHLIKSVPAKTPYRTEDFGVRKICVFGEPGGSVPDIRQRLSDGFGGAQVYDIMGGTGCQNPLGVSCEAHNGIHLHSRDDALIEILDGDMKSMPIEDGVEGEIVLTGLVKECQPLIRWRDKDIIKVSTQPCSCGRPGPRVEFRGRVDDMLLVKGVNVFPNAVRDVVARTSDLVSGDVQILRYSKSPVVEAPVEVRVRMNSGVPVDANPDLVKVLQGQIQNILRFSARVQLVPFSDFEVEYGSTGKAKLVKTIEKA